MASGLDGSGARKVSFKGGRCAAFFEPTTSRATRHTESASQAATYPCDHGRYDSEGDPRRVASRAQPVQQQYVCRAAYTWVVTIEGEFANVARNLPNRYADERA